MRGSLSYSSSSSSSSSIEGRQALFFFDRASHPDSSKNPDQFALCFTLSGMPHAPIEDEDDDENEYDSRCRRCPSLSSCAFTNDSSAA